MCSKTVLNSDTIVFIFFKDENENDEGEEDIPVAMETESLDDQEVSNLALSNSLNNTLHGGTGKGRKHSFFQVRIS